MKTFNLPTKDVVTLSDAAISHFSNIAHNKVVLFGIEGGGCAGFQYMWKILDDTESITDNDDIIQFESFKFAIDGNSLMMVIGSSIDYITDITGSHIAIENPQASAGCGCGESISFK